MEFTWDADKARENKRKHGITFTAAQGALESGLALYADDQFLNDEWRMVMLAPAGRVLLLYIVITLTSGDVHADDTNNAEEADIWNADDTVVRIITARRADEKEQAKYFESSYFEDDLPGRK